MGIIARVRKLIDAVAEVEDLPIWAYRSFLFSAGELLEGIVRTESSGRFDARRYEPHLDRVGRTDAPTDPDRPGVDDGPKEDDASYGLGQVLGSTWRGIVGAPVGTPLDYTLLNKPTFGLAATAEVFKRELAAVRREFPQEMEADLVVRALCRYNGGPTGDAVDETGDVRRRAYVERVCQNAELAAKERKQCAWR
jgi:hypothetical protein